MRPVRFPFAVIPAQAGIHKLHILEVSDTVRFGAGLKMFMDSRLRGNDAEAEGQI